MVTKKLKPILINFLSLLVLVLLFRLIFSVYNHSLFSLELKDYLLSFIYGLRFDLAAIAMIFTPYLLSLFFPWSKLHKLIYLVCISVALYLSMVDVEYYQFVGKRLQISLLGEFDDFISQSFQIALYYWYNTIGFFIVVYLYSKIYQPFCLELKSRIISISSLLILSFIFVRGGLQLKSISPQTAFAGGNFQMGVVTLNPIYTFFRTLNDKRLKKITFFSDDQIAINNLKEDSVSLLTQVYPKQNIVILILESFAMEYLEYAPFVQSLKQKGLFFEKGMANGRRSMEAMPSIFQSFPSLIDEPLYKSNYQTNQFESLPKSLKQKSYNTAFFHGGKLGTMGFDSYALSIGFDRYYSMNDYPNEDHYDGNWGIFDHYFFDFFKGVLNKTNEPFMAAFFSLSTHHPYTIPKEFKNRFPKGELPIHETIGYGDEALKNFFKKSSQEKWFKNTFFIITADHSQKRVTRKFNNIVGSYRVPIIFYHPTIDLKKYQRDIIVSQVDIYPSVLDLLGIEPEKQNLYGKSIFKNGNREVLFKSGENYFLLKNNSVISKSIEGTPTQQQYNYESGELQNDNIDQNLLKTLKSYIQYTNNGLRKDSLYLPK